VSNMKKCLIVVDYQNDFVSGSLGFEGAKLIEREIAKKIRSYKEKSDEVIYTFDTHHNNYMQTQEGGNLPVIHCVENTPGHKLYGEVAEEIRDTDIRFSKNTFGSDGLYSHLKITPYESIELVGLVSNICVLANAVLAKTAAPETPVSVDASCTASFDEKLHQAALDVMESLQIKIT